MRHILIILISILLLSSLLISCTENSPSPVIGDNLSPVIGDNHKGETLYGWGKCCDYVWKGFGDKDTQPKYLGQVKDGKKWTGTVYDNEGINISKYINGVRQK